MNCIAKLGWFALLVHLRVYCATTPAPTRCYKHQYRCDDGECIDKTKLCDGQNDCSDESDESKCNASSCSRLHDFECLSNKECIPREMICNRRYDCEDGSDERNCEEYACLEGKVPCKDNSRCINREWLCDGDKDCDDGWDEKECVSNPPVTSTTAWNPPETTNPSPAWNPPETTNPSCPEHYCEENAECVVIRGQYHCNCSPPFTGEKCERRMTAERGFQDLGMVIGIAMTLITLFIIIALMFFCYYKRRTARNSTALISNSEKQMPFTSYSKE